MSPAPGASPASTERLAGTLSRLPAGLHRLLPFAPRADLRRRLGRRRPWEQGYDVAPPPPDGHLTGPPDFVGVGASLCATAWWYELVLSHPGMARRPGPVGLHYFSHFALSDFTAEDRDRYHRWFPRPAGRLVGEWTPAYAAEPWVAPLLAEAAPRAKLLFLVRDPVERFRLGLARITESRVPNVGAATAEVAERGFYSVQLRRLLEHVPAERVLVLQLERCLDDTAGQLDATHRFLGLDGGARPAAPTRPRGPAEPVAPPLDPAVAARVAEMYAEDAADLALLVPDLDLERWPTMGPARP